MVFSNNEVIAVGLLYYCHYDVEVFQSLVVGYVVVSVLLLFSHDEDGATRIPSAKLLNTGQYMELTKFARYDAMNSSG